MESFGDMLRGYRGSRGLTQEELAERSGLSVYAISMLERGVRTAPRSSTVEVLARALQLDASERAALVAAARRRSVPLPSPLPAAPRSPAPIVPPSRARLWSVSVLSAPPRGVRLAVTALAGLLAVLLIGSVADTLRGAHPVEPQAPPTSLGPPPPSAVVYFTGDNRTLLRRIGYDGSAMDGSWSTTDAPVLSTANAPQQVVGVSPDGENAVTLDAHRQNWLVIDPQDRVVTTVLATMASSEFGTWASDSRHVCRMEIADPLRWQVVVTDVREPNGTKVVPIGLTYPPYTTVEACDAGAGRAVVVQSQATTVPAPSDAERLALVVDLSTGEIVTRAPLGDSTHGVQFSLDGRYVATIDYARGTSSIVSLVTGKAVAEERGEIRGFSADDTRIVVNSQFEPLVTTLGTTRVVDWRAGRVVYSLDGWTSKVRAQPGGTALAMSVTRALNGPTDLVIVPSAGSETLLQDVTLY